MVANRAGIGYNAITRSLGEGVRNNSFHHTGKLPFYRHIDKATKALIQGVRGGAATVHYTFIDPEIEVLLNLKSQRSADDVRIEFLDYCMVYHPYFLELYKANKPLKLISYKDHPEVYDAMYSKVYSDFVRLYEKAPAVKEVSARDVLHTFLIRRAETGRNYWMNSYEANVKSSFLEPIKQSNLCVKGDTNILTDKGYFPIATLEGATITVWNGETWSEVTVQKTGTNQKLLKVTTSQDKFIECTEYHKFYTINSNYVEQVTRAHELKAGDKLTRTILPVLDFGTKVLKSPYTNGFFTGDGTYDSNNRARLYFYEKGGKLPCVNKVDAIISGTGILDSSDRLIYTVESTLEPKYFVPDASYTIDSRVKWLEGFLDADGSLQNNGKTPSVVFSTSNKVFGENVAKLAESLGISIKKTTGSPEQFTMMPDGHGGYKEYLTAETYRYTVCSTDYWKLYDLGLRLNKMKDLKRPNRLCTQFEKVISIVEVEGLHDTYCVTEPKRGKVVFNGILTGNCQEILQPTNAYSHVQDMYVYDEDVGGEISLCNLGGIVFGRVINYERTCYLLLKFIDTIIEMQHLPFPNLEYTSKARRNVAVGIINLANYLAKNGLSYEGQEARTLVYNECKKKIELYII
jgi:ribonucleoside-diphosphate reductase alpha chain